MIQKNKKKKNKKKKRRRIRSRRKKPRIKCLNPLFTCSCFIVTYASTISGLEEEKRTQNKNKKEKRKEENINYFHLWLKRLAYYRLIVLVFFFPFFFTFFHNLAIALFCLFNK
jgi:hypothetical protein